MSFIGTLQTIKDKILPNSRRHITDMHQDYFLLSDNMKQNVREAYNVMRTNLVFLMSQSDRKQLVFTSSMPGEGKTTSTVNTAILFAQTGAKVLLIDADMRRPKVHRIMKKKHSPGLSDVLGKLKPAQKCIQSTNIENLDILAAGTTPPNPSELLLSNQFDALMEEMDKIYDYVFVDAPPIKVITDAVIISTKLSGAIIVVRSGFAHKPEILDSLNSFEAAGGKVLGFILNDIAQEHLSEYGYGSKYYYNQRSASNNLSEN